MAMDNQDSESDSDTDVHQSFRSKRQLQLEDSDPAVPANQAKATKTPRIDGSSSARAGANNVAHTGGTDTRAAGAPQPLVSDKFKLSKHYQ